MTYCTKCGKEISEEAKFCPNCGESKVNSEGIHKTAAETILNDSQLQQHWVKRIIGILIDSIIVAVATSIIGYFINVSGFFNWLNFPIAMGLLYVLYFTIFEIIYGYTIGKKIVNLKVVMQDKKNLDFKSALIRNISKIHPLFLILDFIAGFLISTDPHQKYIDQISNTTIVEG